MGLCGAARGILAVCSDEGAGTFAHAITKPVAAKRTGIASARLSLVADHIIDFPRTTVAPRLRDRGTSHRRLTDRQSQRALTSGKPYSAGNWRASWASASERVFS